MILSYFAKRQSQYYIDISIKNSIGLSSEGRYCETKSYSREREKQRATMEKVHRCLLSLVAEILFTPCRTTHVLPMTCFVGCYNFLCSNRHERAVLLCHIVPIRDISVIKYTRELRHHRRISRRFDIQHTYHIDGKKD